MKTGLEIVEIVRAYLATTVMQDTQKPNGLLCKLQRPLNSLKEDVVVNLLVQSRGQVAEGVLNVNLYVPNLKLTFGGIVDNTQPNYSRLDYLTTLASNALGEVYGNDYNFRVQQDSIFPDDNNQHFSNIRIEFTSINL